MSVYKMSAYKMSADKMSVDKMFADKMPFNLTLAVKMAFQKCQ